MKRVMRVCLLALAAACDGGGADSTGAGPVMAPPPPATSVPAAAPAQGAGAPPPAGTTSPPAPAPAGTAPPSTPSGPPPMPAPMPSRVVITFEGALIGPIKPDGTPWDADGGSVPAELPRLLAAALSSSSPFTQATALIAGPLLAPLAKPDPFGDVTLDGPSGTSMSQDLILREEAIQDTFSPIWRRRATWRGVPLDRDVRFRVALHDRDLVNDDDIGVAQVNTADLRAALAARTVFHVNVASQTRNAILFLDITVRPE